MFPLNNYQKIASIYETLSGMTQTLVQIFTSMHLWPFSHDRATDLIAIQ